MGICSSCESANVATAKLILDDGSLEEFPYPVKVSYVLQKNPSSFICDSDDMDFDDVVSAVDDEDVLVPGQLYFVLPLSRLKQRLRAEEMAALAVKASSALGKSSGDICSGEKCDTVVRRRRCGGGGGGRGRFTAKLSAISE